MYRLLIGVAFFVNHLAFAATIPITFYNYFSSPGAVYVGSNPQVIGPLVELEGTVQWSPVINGSQPVGLQTGPGPGDTLPCFLIGGALVLNSAIYTGDTISIVYGQPQAPFGITCGCLGSACDIA